MTEREQRVHSAECCYRTRLSSLREAQMNMQRGYEKAKAEFERECERLKFEVERATIDVDREKSYLELAKSDLERGFDIGAT